MAVNTVQIVYNIKGYDREYGIDNIKWYGREYGTDAIVTIQQSMSAYNRT